jgi:hypothetical protein
MVRRLALVVCAGKTEDATQHDRVIWAEAELPASISHVRPYIRQLILQLMALLKEREGRGLPIRLSSPGRNQDRLGLLRWQDFIAAIDHSTQVKRSDSSMGTTSGDAMSCQLVNGCCRSTGRDLK